MSHESIWRCLGCRTPLGVVGSDGALEVEGRRVRVGRGGAAFVECGRCGERRAWRPQAQRRRRNAPDAAGSRSPA